MKANELMTVKANELMIGDLVSHFSEGKKCVVTELRGRKVAVSYTDDNGKKKYSVLLPEMAFEPIPTTAEILERNGFNMMPKDACGYDNAIWELDTESGVGVELRMKYGKGVTIWNDTDNDEDAPVYLLPFPRYVHELQHALRLCGINKEITI